MKIKWLLLSVFVSFNFSFLKMLTFFYFYVVEKVDLLFNDFLVACVASKQWI